MINAKILLDSVNPIGNRITTWVLTYPRFIHAEFMTHRVFSRNASSSRAIPVKKMLEDVKNNPAMPVYWGKNQSGMQAAEELSDVCGENEGESKRDAAKRFWLEARDQMVLATEALNGIGLHKQIANRLLEPWMHITVLATATEHQNFFALRAHKDAQPEFQKLAYLMLDLYQQSQPKQLNEGEWHIPFGDDLDEARLGEAIKQTYNFDPSETTLIRNRVRLDIATARCARVSYLNFDGKDDYMADLELTKRLSSSGHWSPFEHCATPAISGTIPHRSGNFIGWKQYRKFFAQENRTDGRVGGAEYNGGATNY